MRPRDSDLWPRPRHVSTVLVVDDEDTIRDFLRSALETENYAVMAAGNGLDALALCERSKPDLILLDLMMPGLDGMGFLHEYRRRFGLDGTPVFIMSAVRTAVDHAKASGVAGAFVKPFDLDEVLARIELALANRGPDGG